MGPRSLARAARATLVLALALGASACTPFDDLMVAVFGRSMRDQPSFDPYENPRMPAEGSVPFAAGNYPARAGDVNVGQPEGLAEDLPPFTNVDMATGVIASALVNPVPADSASLARGGVLYNRFCAVCHGPAGLSTDAPIIEKIPAMAAWPLATGAAVGRTDGYIYGMIRVGRGVMPSYGHRVTHFDRWHVVNYVRQLQARAAGGGAPGAGAAGATGAQAEPGDTAAPRGEG